MRAVVVAGFVLCACSNPVPPDAPGPFVVGHEAFTVTDASRGDRPLDIDVWFPVDADQVKTATRTKYPLAFGLGPESDLAFEGLPASSRSGQTLIVFSHGYGGVNVQSVALTETLASHGFIVAAPEHTGNSQATPDDTFDEAASKRVPDVSFVIDTIAERYAGQVDTSRVGVIGHSFGGMTALGMAAGWGGAEPDPRVAAIVPISAVIDGELQEDDRSGPNSGFTEAQLARIAVPAMLVGGTADDNVPIENNGLAFERMTSAPVVYRVDIIGANHTHFANVCAFGNFLIFEAGIEKDTWPSIGAADLIEPYDTTCGPEAFPIEEVARLLNLYAVSFFRHHLLNDGDYRRFITEGHAKSESAIRFSVK